ncbi:unnamed protein product [Oikopleura dioica]|uniref:Protein kinase domain-containing protein n=1 Tax=Oikopleura dioica TaxID=34765 RepID=E4YXK6_OIKDI|nr:unnamed protein product [Oikopleura dioica]
MKTIVVEISLFCVLLVVVSAFVAIWFKQRHKKPYMTMEWTVNPDCFEPDLAQRDAYYAAGAGGAQVKAEFYINVEDLTAPEEMTYIGTGNYGDIYLAEFKDPEEKNCIHKVAVKFFKDVQDTKKIHKEREAFQTLGRTGGFYHITYYFGWSYINHPSIPMMSTCLVMEYMDCKSLNHYLRTYNPEKNTSGRRADESITIKRLLKMCADVADGMFFLNEELKFIHRDLAARNCLVARHQVNGEVYETVKISDFGLTRSMINDDNKDYYCLDINYIPIRWWPPESIEGGKFMSLGDIWSYGVLLFEIITLGCLPYVDISNAEVKAEIMRNIELNTHEFNVLSKKCWRDMILKSLLAVGIPAKEAEDAYNNITKLIKICCHYEPTKRPTFRDLLDMIAQFDQLNGLKDFQEEYFFYKGRQDESYSIESDCETESTTVNYEATDVVKPLLDSNS